MARRTLEIDDEAFVGYDEICNYIEGRFGLLAKVTFEERFDEEVDFILENPEARRYHNRSKGIRRRLVNGLTEIFYTYSEMTVFVLSIVDGRTDLDRLPF